MLEVDQPGDEADAVLLLDVLVGALDQEDLVLLQVVVDALQPLDDLGGPAVVLVVQESKEVIPLQQYVFLRPNSIEHFLA